MKKKTSSILIGVCAIIIFGALMCYALINNNKNKLYNFVIENVESDIKTGERIKVNSIKYASKKITLNNVELEVKNKKLYINGKFKRVDDDGVLRVTGYYYQPAGTYNIYVLVDEDEIYSLTNVLESEIMEKRFIETEIEDVDKLVLVDITLENDMVGQLPERNRVYAKIDKELVRLR